MIGDIHRIFSLMVPVDFRLRIFDSGVMVIELQSHNEEEMVASALETVSVLRFLQCFDHAGEI